MFHVFICIILFQVLNKVLRQEILIQPTYDVIQSSEAFVLRVSRTKGREFLFHTIGEIIQYVLYITTRLTTLV